MLSTDNGFIRMSSGLASLDEGITGHDQPSVTGEQNLPGPGSGINSTKLSSAESDAESMIAYLKEEGMPPNTGRK